MADSFSPPDVVYGVVLNDHGESAGTGTWITRGDASDGLRIARCDPASEWFDAPNAWPRMVPALTSFLSANSRTAAGLDFPFGLPEPIVTEESWLEFLVELPGWCNGPEDFRRRCERRARQFERTTGADGDQARMRSTDRPVGSLSPYDEAIVESTFYGLRDVLRPLALSGSVCVPPLCGDYSDCVSRGCTNLLEVYPGGTLSDLGLDIQGYTGEGDDARDKRAELVAELDRQFSMPSEIRDSLVDSVGALKSVVAAFAAYRNTRSFDPLSVSEERRTVEGHIFI